MICVSRDRLNYDNHQLEGWLFQSRPQLQDTHDALHLRLPECMKTKIVLIVPLVLAATISLAPAQDKSLGQKTSETLQKAGEKVKETGKAVAETTRKAADSAVDAVTPDKDAHKVDVKLVDHRVEMPKQLATGKTAFVVHNAGKEKHNFQIAGEGIDKKFTANLGPDETKVLQVDLKPGTYKVYCPVGDHEAEGMKLSVTVK